MNFDIRCRGDMDSLVGSYTQAATSGRRQAALDLLLEAVQQGYSLPVIYQRLLEPAMYRIGSLWENNEITVAQEHMATAITQYALARLYPAIPRPTATRGNVLIAGVEGEQHQLGANMVADILELDGWDVRFLGANIPTEMILAAVAEYKSDVVGLSATMPFNLPKAGELVKKLVGKGPTGREIKVVMGGAAFRDAPGFYREIGAHACALDLPSAVEAINQLSA